MLRCCRAQVLRKVTLPLKLDMQHHGIPPMPTAQKKASAARLEEFARKEAVKREVERARNELESFIVNTRSKLGDDEIVAVRLPSLLALLRHCLQ